MRTNASNDAAIAGFELLAARIAIGRVARADQDGRAEHGIWGFSRGTLSRARFRSRKIDLRVRVTLAADRKSVDPVVAQVMAAGREMKCVNGKEDAIELALQEALANAVVHGAKEDPSKVVECLVACDEQRGILIIVRDPGPGFDPQAIPSCTIGENLYSNHGRGIFLINQLMDEVKFHQERHRDSHGKAVGSFATLRPENVHFGLLPRSPPSDNLAECHRISTYP